MYENFRQRIKYFKKMAVETSDENQFSYLYVLNPFIKLFRSDHDVLGRLISQTVSQILTWNLYTASIQVFTLFYQILGSICLIVWKLHTHFGIGNFLSFRQFLFINFDWQGNFKPWWFYRKDHFQIYQNKKRYLISKYIFYL